MLDMILFFGFAAAVARFQLAIGRTKQRLDHTTLIAERIHAELMKG